MNRFISFLWTIIVLIWANMSFKEGNNLLAISQLLLVLVLIIEFAFGGKEE